MNEVHISGWVQQKPEVRYTQTGKTIAEFTVGVPAGKDKGYDYIRCMAWEEIGEYAGHELDKDMRVKVSGKWKTGSYKDKSGKTQYTNKLLVQELALMPQTIQKSGFGSMGQQVADEEVPF